LSDMLHYHTIDLISLLAILACIFSMYLNVFGSTWLYRNLFHACMEMAMAVIVLENKL
jgi:hypothetical protein